MTFSFVRRDVVDVLHALQIARHGGAPGLRDEGAFESALARPLNKAHYGCDDLFELAAAYLFGLARDHPFIDGNKRTAIATAAVFLMDNGREIETDDAALFLFVLGVAAGEIDEAGAARFFRDHTAPAE